MSVSLSVSTLEPLALEKLVVFALPLSTNCPPLPLVRTRLAPAVEIVLLPI